MLRTKIPWSNREENDSPNDSPTLRKRWADGDVLDQLAGITGLGWTMSVLGFLSTALGYGNWLVARLVTAPQSLLYLGAVLFVVTLGLDRLKETLTDGDS